MEKFENLKEFRDLDSLKLINEDKSTENLMINLRIYKRFIHW